MVSIFFTDCTFWVPGDSIFDVSGTLGGIGMLAVRKDMFLHDFGLVLGCHREALSATWAPFFAPKRLSGAMGWDAKGEFSGSWCRSVIFKETELNGKCSMCIWISLAWSKRTSAFSGSASANTTKSHPRGSILGSFLKGLGQVSVPQTDFSGK